MMGQGRGKGGAGRGGEACAEECRFLRTVERLPHGRRNEWQYRRISVVSRLPINIIENLLDGVSFLRLRDFILHICI